MKGGKDWRRGDLHCHPSPCLIIVTDRSRGHHFRIRQLLASGPAAHVLKAVHFDRVVVARGRDVPGRAKRRVADAEPAFVLAHQRRRALVLATAATDLSQVPHAHEAVQGGGGEEVWLRWVEGEAADFLV